MSVSEASRTGLSGDRGADASATGALHLFNIQRLRHFLSVLIGLAAFGKRASLRGIMTHIRVRRAGERGAKRKVDSPSAREGGKKCYVGMQ